MTSTSRSRPATAVLELAGCSPLVLEDCEFAEAVALPDGRHQARVTGWTDHRQAVPRGPQALLCARLPGRKPFAVAHVQVHAAVPVNDRQDVVVEWRAGMELPAPDGSLKPADAVRSLAEQNGKTPFGLLAERILRRAARAARGWADDDELHALAEDCRQVARRDPRTPPCHVPDTDHPDPAMLLQEVSAVWHTTVYRAGVLRLYLRPFTSTSGTLADALAVLGLSTLPLTVPDDPTQAVLLYCANSPAAGLLSAAAHLRISDR
ncbi:hypothetical protein [Streptomyces justiciae]|uniref:hypothetical protein n=1 Tax=Streptomyces justiciae TaxID=2780140 RepID=UPI0021175200|nr:hypothetical protein [Streptomyces justiciae]MCW8383969.1 hypothetical protein [Streptomyces justiciae]